MFTTVCYSAFCHLLSKDDEIECCSKSASRQKTTTAENNNEKKDIAKKKEAKTRINQSLQKKYRYIFLNMTVVNNNDSNDNVSHHQHHSNIVEEMNNTTATTATTSNTTTAAAATSTTSTSLLSSSSPTDHHNGETNNIIEYLQGIVNHDYNNNLTDTPIPFLQVISGEVATIVKRLQQGHIIPQSQQQKTQQGRHNNKQHTEQQHNNNSNETIMTEGVSSSLLSADPMIAYWYLKAATKLINITISYVSTNGDNNNNMMMSNNAGGGLLVDKNKNNSNNSRNPFSTKLNIKDNNNHYNKTDHFAPLQEVLEVRFVCLFFVTLFFFKSFMLQYIYVSQYDFGIRKMK